MYARSVWTFFTWMQTKSAKMALSVTAKCTNPKLFVKNAKITTINLKEFANKEILEGV